RRPGFGSEPPTADSRHRPGREADGSVLRGRDLENSRRKKNRALQIQGLWNAGDDRPQCGGRATRALQAVGVPRLAPVAGRGHLLPDRLPQPDGRAARLGLGVLDPAALRAHRAAEIAPYFAAESCFSVKTKLSLSSGLWQPKHSAWLIGRCCFSSEKTA